MTHSSSRQAFVLVRWFAVVAILFTFLSPFGATAQDDASPVPPEETAVVEPTAESTEPVVATETPTEVIEATETPTATEETVESPEGTPTEESQFSGAGVTDNGFSAPSYSGAPGDTINIQYTITMDSALFPQTLATFFAPASFTVTSVSGANPALGSVCAAVGIGATSFTVTYAPSLIAASTCTVNFSIQVPVSAVPGPYLVQVIGSISDSTTIQVIDPNAPTLTLSLSPSTASVGEEVTVTATLVDPTALFSAGSINVPIPANTLIVPGSATALCSTPCNPAPVPTLNASAASTAYFSSNSPLTVTLTFKVTVAPAALPGVPITFNATGTVNSQPLNATPLAITVLDANAPTLALSFSPPTAVPGQEVTVTATLVDPNPAFSGGSISVPISANVVVVPLSATATCSPSCMVPPIPVLNDSAASTNYTSLTGPRTVTLTFKITVADSALPGVYISFTATGFASSVALSDMESLEIIAPASSPTLSISLSDTAPSPGDTITVTVVQTDVAVAIPFSASIWATLPLGVTLSLTPPTITCSPACQIPPFVTGVVSMVDGSYAPMFSTPTTVTMIFDVTVSLGAIQGQLLSFGATGMSAGAVPTTAPNAGATVSTNPLALPLTVSANPTSAEPGQTVSISATVIEPTSGGSQQGSIVVTIPDGTTLVPNSGVFSCVDCSSIVTESATQVSATYTLGSFPLNLLSLNFQVTVDADAPVGSTLSFTGSGTDSFGAPMTVTPGSLTIVAVGSAPTLTIALSETSAAPGDTVEVTVTQFDPGTGSGTVDSAAPPLTALVPGSAEISCTPACVPPPSVVEQLGALAHGTYTTTGPTTITMTFEVTVSSFAPVPTIPFIANGQSANGTSLIAAPVNLTITAAPVDLTFTAVPGTAYPGETVTVTVIMPEGIAVGLGTITADLPEGVTLAAALPIANCALCAPTFLTDADSVTMNYALIVPIPAPVGFTFQVTIDGSTPGGTVLTFTGSGTPVSGGPTTPVPASVTVLAPLAAPTLNLEVALGANLAGDLTTTVTGGVPPFSFIETGASNPTGTLNLNGNGWFNYSSSVLGLDSFEYQVTDSSSGTPLTAVGTVNINVVPAPIVVAPKSITVVSGETVNDTVVGQATGGTPPYEFALVSGPSLGVLDLDLDGTFEYTANENIAGTDQFTYTVTDTLTGGPVTGVVNITITAAPLVISPLVLNVVSGQVITGDLNDTVSGGIPPYTFSVNQAPGLGTLDLNPDGTFTFTAPVGVAGTTSFAYNVTDSQVQGVGEVSGSATATGEVQIIIAAAALTTVPLSVNVDAGASVNGTVAGQVSGGVLPYTFTLVSNPTQGTVTTFNADGSFTYTANADAEGTDQFVYTVTDSEIVITGEVDGAATATGVVDIIIAAPTPTPTETAVPTETTVPTATATTEPGVTPTATATTEPGATPTTDPGDPTAEPTGVTELPNTGQGDNGPGSSTSMLVALLTGGMLLLAVAAGRLRRP